MSLGLPSHLARVTLGLAFARALHAVAAAALLCSVLVIVSFMAARPGLVLWPALLVVLFMGLALWLNDRYESVLFDVSYLTVGAAGVYWYCLTFQTQLPDVVESDAIWLALPKIAVVMVAGAGIGPFAALGWAVLGYLVAELAALVATLQTGVSFEVDASTLVAFLLAVTTIALIEVARYRARKTQPQLHRAARDERMAAFRSEMELKAAALLHDTVLSHLAAIAHAPNTELGEGLAEQIRHDLEVLIGEEWLSEPPPAAVATTDWRQSALFVAVQEGRMQGLTIDGSGDMAAVLRLDKARSSALGLAVKQCLINVIKHSGTMNAEVSVYGSETEVSVMVIDAGRGFVVDSVGTDRLGLRASVRRRMEAVGGTVQLWSTPGSGTSILIQVPVVLAATAVPRTEGRDVVVPTELETSASGITVEAGEPR